MAYQLGSTRLSSTRGAHVYIQHSGPGLGLLGGKAGAGEFTGRKLGLQVFFPGGVDALANQTQGGVAPYVHKLGAGSKAYQALMAEAGGAKGYTRPRMPARQCAPG